MYKYPLCKHIITYYIMLQLAPEDVPLHHRMGRIRCESVRLADPEDLWGRDLSNTTKSGLHR